MGTYPCEQDRLWLKLYSHYPRLVSSARAWGADADAEDVASTVLLRVASRCDESVAVTWPYLARAVRNELIDRHRRSSREKELAWRSFERIHTSDVEDQAIAAVEAHRLISVVVRGQRETTALMIRSRLTGLSWREVADQFGLSPPAVQARVRRALVRVKPVWRSRENSA